MRRGAVSVAANIVEGSARRSQAEYLNFLNIAFGSLREVGYYVTLAKRLGYVNETVAQTLLGQYDESAIILLRLINSLS